jgi:hypothetical protein
MAKKKATRGEFNMSEEIRNILKENPTFSSNEVYAKLQESFPDQTINRGSCNVAYSHARAKLGLRGSNKKSVKVRRPGRKAAPATTTVGTRSSASASRQEVNFTLLKAAQAFLKEAGSAEAAISAIQQIDALQIR